MNMAPKNNNKVDSEKILLMTLPFLTPLIPPMGISCLKAYLEENGCFVKTVDVMANMEIREYCYRYFDTLQGYIPEKKQGHFFNVGLDVLYNHFMAHVNYIDEQKYIQLVNVLVAKNFFVQIDEEQVRQLNHIVEGFFSQLGDYLITLFKREKPTVFGLSVYKGTLASSYFAAKLIKEKFPTIKILMGGTIFSQELYPGSPNFNRFLDKAPFIDKIFIGESETLFLKYLRGELPEDQKIFTLKDVDDRLLDLNVVPMPDFSDFDLSSYPLLPGFASRGCIYKCSFCAETVYWKQYNRKNAEIVADDFEEMIRKYGRRLFVLTDCMINPLVTELSQDIIKRNLNAYWDVYIKIDKQVCDPDQTLLWRRGGFYRARLGIESGSQKVLDLIDKRITLQQIKDGLRSLASAGIKTTTYWIAGHPGETEEDFQQTLDLLEELQDSIFEAECDPFRYFYNGQVNADEWLNQKGNLLLYPEDATDMLITQSYSLNTYPNRETIYDRGCRFKEKCKELGIPNPYSIRDLMAADMRWQNIQPNAVPPVMELNNNPEKYLGEQEGVTRILSAHNYQSEDVDFGF
jgi:radical SAM superfamily enzyme YgiQ (UPF0313 family)